jgi:TRAP-type C4-dicarboxylate transport system permease small subunit
MPTDRPNNRPLDDGDQTVHSDAKSAAEEPTTAIGRFAATVSTAAGVLSGICIVGILLIVCSEVVLRQFKASMLVTDEIAGYLNAAAVFLGLAYTLREGGFIRVEIVYDSLPAFWKLVARWIFTIIAAIFVAIILHYSVQHVLYAFNQDTRAISVLNTPEWLPQSVMVIGLAVLLLQLVAFLIERVRNVP